MYRRPPFREAGVDSRIRIRALGVEGGGIRGLWRKSREFSGEQTSQRNVGLRKSLPEGGPAGSRKGRVYEYAA